ncbi:MAG: sugar phosphate isomerase/epimerase [Clostridia bacterium]|nr:sugar phosphate isomerase/epimerase [Clostridia bacterium]
MSAIKLGAQLYTLREFIQTRDDFEATLRYLAGIDIHLIQISGIGPIPAEEIAALTQAYGMEVCVTHTSFDRMQTELDAVMAEHRLFHCDTLGIGAMPDKYRGSLEGVKEFIRIASEIGRRMHENGLQFAYHNHAFEFARLENGARIFDYLIESTQPEFFSFIGDTYWFQYGGVNPADYIRKLNGRMKVCHFKDYKILNGQPTFAEIGTGNLDLDACYLACRDAGVKDIVIEQDTCEIDPRESMAISYRNLIKIAERNQVK